MPLKSEVLTVVATQLKIPADQVSSGTSLAEYIESDPIMVIELFEVLSEELGVEFSDTDIDNLLEGDLTVGELVDYIVEDKFVPDGDAVDVTDDPGAGLFTVEDDQVVFAKNNNVLVALGEDEELAKAVKAEHADVYVFGTNDDAMEYCRMYWYTEEGGLLKLEFDAGESYCDDDDMPAECLGYIMDLAVAPNAEHFAALVNDDCDAKLVIAARNGKHKEESLVSAGEFADLRWLDDQVLIFFSDDELSIYDITVGDFIMEDELTTEQTAILNG